MTKTKTNAGQPLSPATKKTIIISAICVVMIVVLVVSLVLVLKKPEETPSESTKPNPGSSTLYIKNGDFAYFDTEAETYPKAATNWTTYTYKAPASGSSHGFEALSSTDKVLYGVVDISDTEDKNEWATVVSNLSDAGITGVANPTLRDAESLDTNVYMFATKQATSACIMSSSFSIPSQTSAKITVYLNTYQLAAGSTATIALQKYSSTAPSALASDRHAYTLNIGKTEKNEWVAYEFYLFNRQSSSSLVAVNVGIGNCYGVETEVEGSEDKTVTEVTGEGILFVDDVTYESVSSNEYREYLASVATSEDEPTNYKIIGEDKKIEASEYAMLQTPQNLPAQYLSLDEYLNLAVAADGKHYSPFTGNDSFSVFYVTNDGTDRNPAYMVLDNKDGNPIEVKSSEDKNDHLHIYFWVRVDQQSQPAQGNIIVQTLENGDWMDLNGGSFTKIAPSSDDDKDISVHSNCGWTKYDIYLKPTTAASTTIRILFALGDYNGYNATEKYLPKGTLYVTSPYIENVTSSNYSSASSGSYCKKVSLVGDIASTTINNGSFSTISTSNANQPTNWTPVFAGYNILYRDGKGNIIPEGLPTGFGDASAVIVKNNKENNAPAHDDSEQNVLKLTNNVATAYGYLSGDINLSAHAAYAITFLAKTDGTTKPYAYVIKNGEPRESAVIGKIEGAVTADETTDATDEKFCLIGSSEEGNGWTRYYIVVVTGDEGFAVRVALFNGSIDGSARQSGSVYYDHVTSINLGNYTIDTATYEDGDENAPATDRDRISFTATSGYTVFEKLTDAEISTTKALSNVDVSAPDLNKLVADALAEANKEEEPTTTEKEKTPVNVALLLSVISSVALVGAMLIVVVIKVFRKRSNV